MNIVRISATLAAGLVAGAVGLGVGAAVGGHLSLGSPAVAADPAPASVVTTSEEDAVATLAGMGLDVPAVQTNANGQTYGSSIALPQEDWPDLVLVVNQDGQEGYLPKELLITPTAATPEEATALMSRVSAQSTTIVDAQMLDEQGDPIPGLTKHLDAH